MFIINIKFQTVNSYRFKVDLTEVITSRKTTPNDSNDSNSSESFCPTDSKESARKNDLSNLNTIFLVMNQTALRVLFKKLLKKC